MVAWHDHELEHVKEWSRPYQKGQEESFVCPATVAHCDLCPDRPFGLQCCAIVTCFVALLISFKCRVQCVLNLDMRVGEMAAFSFPMLLFKYLCAAYHD